MLAAAGVARQFDAVSVVDRDRLPHAPMPRPGVPQGNGVAGYSDRGSPNQGSTPASKRVMAQIRSPARVST